MRIAVLGDYPLDPGRIWGGEQAAFAYLVKELCAIGDLDVHVVTLASAATAPEVRESAGGPTVHVLARAPRSELLRRFPTYRAQAAEVLAKVQPDVVHAQGAIHHGYVALQSGFPAVITVHGVQSEDCKYQKTLYLRLRKRFVSFWVERYNLKNTHHLIAISRYVTAYFARLLRPGVQVHYIPNAIDGRFFDLEDRSDAGTILFAGRIIQRKRPLDLVKAFAMIAAEVPGSQLRLAGEFESEPATTEAVRGHVREAGLEDRVQFLGSLGEEDVIREFGACDVLALPSSQETTPMVIAQAMAAAKPVVATPVGGVGEMVQDGETGFLVGVDDVAGLSARLLRLLTDARLRKRLGAAGREFAVENYRADNVAKRTCDVYRGMVGTAT